MISMDDKYRSKGKIAGPVHVVEIDYVLTSSKICVFTRLEAGSKTCNVYHELCPVDLRNE